MSPERWADIERVYHAALGRDVGERAAFLRDTCAGDEELRREVEGLLAQQASRDFMDAPGIAVAAEMASTAGASVLTGRRIGVYQIHALLGAGGMGEVYRARDTKLGRDVAIKILPPEFTSHPDRLARFQREARVLASLNHPHIGAIYGIEDAPCEAGPHVHALVLELVEGQTLADRIARGAVPIADALAIARQIADALDAAHEKGIVHRDLKPANIKITAAGVVKVLDFGLAKLEAKSGEGAEGVSESPTITVNDTREGLIVGTAAYMSPEQARGQAVDKRTDIWAFGCVLYEMLTGRAAFGAENVSDTIAALIAREPDWRVLPPSTPATIRDLLAQCLEKDSSRRLRNIARARIELAEAIDREQRSRLGQPALRRATVWLGAAVGTAIIVAVALYAWRASSEREPVAHNETGLVSSQQWIQLTRLADAVSQPALSSDGRMLTFVRGRDTFLTPGEIYLKILPDGEAVQLTHDSTRKMSPVFSPDGSSIAYTSSDGNSRWDTWVVPISGAQPHVWLPNASGLTWVDKQRILFSEIKNNDIHMAIVAAEQSRAGARDVYVPSGERDMAHRSYVSPDGRWALVVQMDRGTWQPCRMVAMEGGSSPRLVGPPGAGCTSAAWSPDGKWIFVNSAAGGAFHIWRQRFPDGAPEQITSGPTEEEGIAIAPDGRSFVTAVGLQQSAVWLHDSRGDRQLTIEGYAANPIFATDGTGVVYRIVSGTLPTNVGELRMLDLETGREESVLPGFAVAAQVGRADYDISPDGQRVVVSRLDREGKRRLWLASLDRRSPPQQIPNVEGDDPLFGDDDEIFFRRLEGESAFAYRVRRDGSGLRKVNEQAIATIFSLAPDHRWLVARVPGPSMVAFPVAGGPLVNIARGDASQGNLKWSRDGRSIFISVLPGGTSGRTYVIPLIPGRMFPFIPAEGFSSEAEIAKVSGARLIDSYDVAPGRTGDVYAFSRLAVQRNLYRVPLP